MPNAVVVIEEFSRLTEADPGLAGVVYGLMREGRNLGICVLIVSEDSDFTTSGLRSVADNSRYRIALKANLPEIVTGADRQRCRLSATGKSGLGSLVSASGC